MTVAIPILIISAFVAVREWKRRSDAAEDPAPDYFDAAQLHAEITALSHAMEDLETLDGMIIDLRLCKPDELHRSFRISWSSSQGEKAIDFMSTGTNTNTADLMQLAQDQREELNASIRLMIDNLHLMAENPSYMAECSYQNSEQYDFRQGSDCA